MTSTRILLLIDVVSWVAGGCTKKEVGYIEPDSLLMSS